jgi:catechol-2,3-dioxygenase
MASIHLDSIILYVQNVDKLKAFYMHCFQMELLEEYPQEWVLLKAGTAKLGLHKMGEAYQPVNTASPGEANNCKIVFEIEQDIHELRNQLLNMNIAMRSVKTFDNYHYWLCDGADPEGNIFQLKQRKASTAE